MRVRGAPIGREEGSRRQPSSRQGRERPGEAGGAHARKHGASAGGRERQGGEGGGGRAGGGRGRGGEGGGGGGGGGGPAGTAARFSVRLRSSAARARAEGAIQSGGCVSREGGLWRGVGGKRGTRDTVYFGGIDLLPKNEKWGAHAASIPPLHRGRPGGRVRAGVRGRGGGGALVKNGEGPVVGRSRRPHGFARAP